MPVAGVEIIVAESGRARKNQIHTAHRVSFDTLYQPRQQSCSYKRPVDIETFIDETSLTPRTVRHDEGLEIAGHDNVGGADRYLHTTKGQ